MGVPVRGELLQPAFEVARMLHCCRLKCGNLALVIHAPLERVDCLVDLAQALEGLAQSKQRAGTIAMPADVFGVSTAELLAAGDGGPVWLE